MPGRRTPERVRILAFLAAAAGLSVLWLLTDGGAFRQAASFLAAPARLAGSAVTGLFDGQSGREEELTGRVDALTAENARLQALASENESLRSLLGVAEREGAAAVAAKVTYEYDDGVSRTLALDRGSADGLAVGQPVIVGDGVIVGKIGSVRRHTAAVMPLTDSRSRLAVTVQNRQDTLGVLEGSRGISLSMELIPQTEEISEGETVITSGLEAGIRRGLVVGYVDSVIRVPQEPFQSAAVAQFSSWRHPHYVMVLIGGDTESDRP